MKTSIATVSISGTFEEKLVAIQNAGFDGIEIFEQDFLASALTPREAARMVEDHGLEITLFQPFRDFEGLPGQLRERAFARAERKFDLMAELNTDLVLFCSSVHPETLGGIDRAAEDYHALGEIAARRGIKVGYEALAWGKYVSDHRDAWEVVRRANHPNIGIILDSFHTLGRKIDPGTIRSIPGDKIFFVQMADAPAIEMDLLYWSRHFRNMPGEGDLDVVGFTRAVMATGYRGPLSLEIFNDQFRGGIPRLVAKDGHRSLIWLMDEVRRAEPLIDIPGAQFPPPVRVDAVEFLEFATTKAETANLEAIFTSAGFENVGKHRTKSVTHWKQGAVNLLLNTSEDGFSQTSWRVHGTVVTEVGLKVGCADEAAERAIALGAEKHESARAVDELDVPGVRSAGNTVLRFLDDNSTLKDIWKIDFDSAEPRDKGIGICGIDHIAETMAYDEMLSWSLFYTTLFASTRTPMVDVIDPDGVVRSQAITSGALRVTLNGAETHRTLAGKFISDTFGASVQHIAFASSDIFKTAEALAKSDFPVLDLQENYYADLAARFALTDETILNLRRHNILYDEDADGQFYQIFSKPLMGGIFLEIVQRVDGYKGYGGPNAPFRIAAMKRLQRPASIPRL